MNEELDLDAVSGINNQSPIPALKSKGEELTVHSMFNTIQGEGPYTGHRATFVRLAGCNLQCPACDTEYTNGAETVNINVLVGKIISQDYSNLVVITGGEPFRQNITLFCMALLIAGFKVQIETNGVLPPQQIDLFRILHASGSVAIVVSPKTSRISPLIEELASAYKYVIECSSINPDDGLPVKALHHTAKPFVARPSSSFTGDIYVNPMDEDDTTLNQSHLIAAVNSCKTHGYILGIQLHKLIGEE